jgi:DNA ligase-associated metallophosphoesterase
MEAPILHTVHTQKLWLSAERTIFWEEEKALILSDLHFGKTGHFRKSGIAVPQTVYKEDLQRLVTQLHYFKPEKLIVVGDFFHSHANTELELFKKWRTDFSNLKIILVKGNHDILKKEWYTEADITVVDDELHMKPFSFSHDKCTIKKGSYLFCGHIHPGVILAGLGKQTLRFPCFYFNGEYSILPAFSRFTGTYPVDPRKGDHVFALVENRIVRLQ